DILIPYFKTGLENNEFCLGVVADPLREDEARDALRRAIPDADERLEAGHIELIPVIALLSPPHKETSRSDQLEIVPATNWYLKEGAFDPEPGTTALRERLAAALAKGYEGMRANGNDAWLTKGEW